MAMNSNNKVKVLYTNNLDQAMSFKKLEYAENQVLELQKILPQHEFSAIKIEYGDQVVYYIAVRKDGGVFHKYVDCLIIDATTEPVEHKSKNYNYLPSKSQWN